MELITQVTKPNSFPSQASEKPPVQSEFNSPRDQPIPTDKDLESIPKCHKTPSFLLPPQSTSKRGKKCLVLDLDETLVHSKFTTEGHYDIKLSIDIEGLKQIVYVSKRPHVDDFIKTCAENFELIVFTASLEKYASPLLDILDPNKVIDFRLYRESCTYYRGEYVKDLCRLGRPLNQTIIVDNSPHSYLFNPLNAIPCQSWFDDRSDTELLELLEILKPMVDPKVDDVLKEIKIWRETKRQNNSNKLYDKIISFVKKFWE
jgi:RNA polymerase II subunit A small phosphatase-like protein